MFLWCGMHRQRAKQSANNCCAIAISDVTLSKREQVIEVRIRWQTEALTALTVTRPKPVADVRVLILWSLLGLVNSPLRAPQRTLPSSSIMTDYLQRCEAASRRARS